MTNKNNNLTEESKQNKNIAVLFIKKNKTKKTLCDPTSETTRVNNHYDATNSCKMQIKSYKQKHNRFKQ